jgi:hydroxyacylglutathione hydrolase
VPGQFRGRAERLGTLHPVLVLSSQATVFATSCFLVAAHAGGPCLVVDPGAGAVDEVDRLARGHGLRPVAAAATHGHPDHVWDAAAVADRWGVPFLIAPADLDRLTDPAASLGPGMIEAFTALAGTPWRPPETVVPLPSGDLAAALGPLGVEIGLDVALLPAPGHTPGSTLYVVRGDLDPASELPASAGGLLPPSRTFVLTGDVLFAGSIGRVDLPGGDGATMVRTLRGLRDAVPPDAWVLPGHGPVSTMGRELATNPYLDARWLASAVL